MSGHLTSPAPLPRRAALRLFAGAPALAILPAAMSAAPVDPIFAAIERHRLAWAAFDASCERTDSVLARNQGHEVTQADEDARDEANCGQQRLLDQRHPELDVAQILGRKLFFTLEQLGDRQPAKGMGRAFDVHLIGFCRRRLADG